MPLPSPTAGDPVELEELLPVPVGAASFRVKGHIYQKMMDNLEQTLEGGRERLLERVEDETIRDFARQRFLGGGWYDALPMGPLAHAHARIVGVALHPHCRERGRIVATHDVPGIYKALLRLFSPELLVPRLPRVATFYFNFGHATADQKAEGRVRTTLGGLPYSLAPMLAGVVEGFIAVALEQSGAKGLVVRTLDVTYDGEVIDGIPTAAVRHESTWKTTKNER
ncbi:MAG TPA: hypothetical protein VLT33_50710 [Labilithrix sp.]|nr:hypothetical protein [Labilithrix sp.]